MKGQRCTGVAASYCDVHGECSCPSERRPDGDWIGEREDPGCPLHAPESAHAVGLS